MNRNDVCKVLIAHKAPTPAPIEEPLPEEREHPIPVEEPVPDHNPSIIS